MHNRLKAGGEGDDRGWDGWMASLTQWTWVWVNSDSWWWTRKPGVLQSMGLQRLGHNWATELNWTVPMQKEKNVYNRLYWWSSNSGSIVLHFHTWSQYLRHTSKETSSSLPPPVEATFVSTASSRACISLLHCIMSWLIDAAFLTKKTSLKKTDNTRKKIAKCLQSSMLF